MRTEKVFTLECYQYREDKTRKIRVHTGTFEANRDFLSGCMYWTREYYAGTKKEAINKARQVVRALTDSGVKHTLTACLFAGAIFLASCNSGQPDPKKYVQLLEATKHAQVDSTAQETETKVIFRCGATTKKGTPCRNRVKEAGQHCHMHQ